MKLPHRIPITAVTPIHPPILPDRTTDVALSCLYQVEKPIGGDNPHWPGIAIGYGGGTQRFVAEFDGLNYQAQNDDGSEMQIEGGEMFDHGDSGGALLPDPTWVAAGAESTTLLCGVISFSMNYGVTETDVAAPVDSLNNVTFLAPFVVDSKGNFLGECNHERPECATTTFSGDLLGCDLDGDDDGIPDACDPCPLKPDPDYLSTGVKLSYGLDSDKDGVADECDNCPLNANVSYAYVCVLPDPSDPSQCSQWEGKFTQSDQDNDGLGDECDMCSGGMSSTPARMDWTCCDTDADCGNDNGCIIADLNKDWGTHPCASGKRCARSIHSDTDAFGDLCDNCPDKPNNDQYDADGDGAGDVCDDCPCDDTVQNAWSTTQGQSDGDGFCEACNDYGPKKDPWNHCSAQFCVPGGMILDSCPKVFSDENQNCNLIAEQAVGAQILADACDPVPCPYFDSQPKSQSVVQRMPCSGYPERQGEYDVVAYSTGALSITPIGAHDTPDLVTTKITDAYLVPEYPVTVDWTAYRYCFDVPGSVDCTEKTWVDDTRLNDPGGSRGAEVYNSGWHRVSIAEIDPPSTTDNPHDTAINPYNSKLANNMSPNTYYRTWNWEDDFGVWSQKGWAQVPAKTGDGSGRLWLHASTWAGMKTDPQYSGHGIHGQAAATSTPSHWLANHYQDLDPITTNREGGCRWVAVGPPLDLRKYLSARPCYSCAVEQLVPGIELVGHPDFNDAITQTVNGSPYDAQWVVSAVGWDSTIGVLTADGTLIDVSDRFGTGLQASMALGLNWVDAAEPQPLAGIGAKAPSAIGLSADGTAIVDRMYLAGGMLLGQYDLRTGGGRGAPSAAVAQASSSRTQTSPAPRQNFIAVYSRSMRQLFLVGGADASSHENLGDIWSTSTDWTQWNPVPLHGVTVGKVLAATYSPLDRQLWILDELSSGGRKQARLMRVVPGTGAVEVLGRWPRLGVFDKLWLVVDRNGTVLLAASSDKVNKHVIIHIQNEASPPRVDRTYAANRALALPPLVDGLGYAFATIVSKHKMPVTVRKATLDGGIGHWGDIGTCL